MVMDYRRQLNIFNPADFQDVYVTIVGLGNIGSHAALTLARMGIQHFMLFDHDIIEEHNLSSQAYGVSAIGKSKAITLAEMIQEVNPDAEVIPRVEEFTGAESYFSDIFICAIDSLEGRKKVAGSLKAQAGQARHIIDARCGGNQIELYSPADWAAWEQSLPDRAAEDPCGGRYIAYVSAIIGGLIANQVKKFLTKAEYDKSIMLDVNSLQVMRNFEW